MEAGTKINGHVIKLDCDLNSNYSDILVPGLTSLRFKDIQKFLVDAMDGKFDNNFNTPTKINNFRKVVKSLCSLLLLMDSVTIDSSDVNTKDYIKSICKLKFGTEMPHAEELAKSVDNFMTIITSNPTKTNGKCCSIEWKKDHQRNPTKRRPGSRDIKLTRYFWLILFGFYMILINFFFYFRTMQSNSRLGSRCWTYWKEIRD